MENKVAAGSLLVHNLAHGLMSNVETSAYLWDLSNCQNRATKNMIINWSLNAMVGKATNIYKNHPVVIITARNLKRDLEQFLRKQANADDKIKFSDVLKQYSVKIMSNSQELEIYRFPENVIIINIEPQILCKSSSVYHFLKKKNGCCDEILQLLLDIQKHFEFSKFALFMDSLEHLFMLNQNQPNSLLKLLKKISLQQKQIFPLITHCDFNLMQSDGFNALSNNFETLIKKQANGLIRVEKQINHNLMIYASAIKSGSRFTDETSVLQITEQHGVRLTGSEKLSEIFDKESKVEAATRDINVKSTFRIEMRDDEKKNRDKHEQSLYHTGIKLEEEDQREIEDHQLKQIQEGQHESSDEGDGDDYGDDDDKEDLDDDLDF